MTARPRKRNASRMSIPTIRGALVILRMWTERWEPSTAEVQEYLGMADHSGAYRLMCRLSGATVLVGPPRRVSRGEGGEGESAFYLVRR